MDSIQVLFLIVATAMLSSFFTILGAYLFFKAFLMEKLRKEIDEAGSLIKERLHAGVSEAGKELLPDFREEVKSGFTESLTSALSGEIIPKTARQLAKNSQSLVEQGLSFLMGRSSADSPSEEEEKSKPIQK